MQPAAAAGGGGALTAEQRARIDQNRLAALARRQETLAGAAVAVAPALTLGPVVFPHAASAARTPLCTLADTPAGAHPRAPSEPLPHSEPQPPQSAPRGGVDAAPNAAQENADEADVSADVAAVAACDPAAASAPRACARQVFDWIAVVDFESTCDDPVNAEPQEIIEFPCVLLNTRSLELSPNEFQLYCRPTEHPRLSAFCTRLTGITQDRVDAGVPLASALEAHAAWLRQHGLLSDAAGEAPRFAVCTWSEWDCKVQLHGEARWRGIQVPPYLQSWIDLKKVFAVLWPRAQGGLAEACATAGVAWEGRAHSGLDDARNTARLAARCIAKGAVLRITGGFAGFAPAAPRQATLMESFGASAAPARAGGAPKCGCGVPAVVRVVRRPGPNNGRAFYSCGRYKATTGAVCDTFQWAPEGTKPPPDAWRGRRRRRNNSQSSE